MECTGIHVGCRDEAMESGGQIFGGEIEVLSLHVMYVCKDKPSQMATLKIKYPYPPSEG